MSKCQNWISVWAPFIQGNQKKKYFQLRSSGDHIQNWQRAPSSRQLGLLVANYNISSNLCKDIVIWSRGKQNILSFLHLNFVFQVYNFSEYRMRAIFSEGTGWHHHKHCFSSSFKYSHTPTSYLLKAFLKTWRVNIGSVWRDESVQQTMLEDLLIPVDIKTCWNVKVFT